MNLLSVYFHSQDESSERFIGEWMENRGIRNQMFVATKVWDIMHMLALNVSCASLLQYTSNFKQGEGPEFGSRAMYTGNSIKSMSISVEESLKKLRTNYIDLLYVHWWDYTTPIEEVMNGLHNLVTQGKVLYLVHPCEWPHFVSTLTDLSGLPHRVSRILLLGSCQPQTRMLRTTARRLSSSTKAPGVS